MTEAQIWAMWAGITLVVALAVMFLWDRRLFRDAERNGGRLDVGLAILRATPPAEDLSRPPVHIERSPLVYRPAMAEPRHGSDVYAAPHNHRARHALLGGRDPLIAARIEKTGVVDTRELFERLAADEGHPVRVHGPVEPVRTYVEPVQLALPLRGLGPTFEEVRSGVNR